MNKLYNHYATNPVLKENLMIRFIDRNLKTIVSLLPWLTLLVGIVTAMKGYKGGIGLAVLGLTLIDWKKLDEWFNKLIH